MEADLDKLAPIGPLTEWLDAHVPELGKGKDFLATVRPLFAEGKP